MQIYLVSLEISRETHCRSRFQLFSKQSTKNQHSHVLTSSHHVNTILKQTYKYLDTNNLYDQMRSYIIGNYSLMMNLQLFICIPRCAALLVIIYKLFTDNSWVLLSLRLNNKLLLRNECNILVHLDWCWFAVIARGHHTHTHT